MQHFFRSLPFAPYAYNYHPDGCEVGKYTPEYRFVKKRTQTVTADRFKDPRQHKHPAKSTAETYPTCTKEGKHHCQLRARQEVRGGKSLLSESTIRRLNPKSSAIDQKMDAQAKEKPSVDSPTKTKDDDNSPNPNKSSLRNSVNRVDTDDLEQGEKKRPHTANQTHLARNNRRDKYDFLPKELRQIRRFEQTLSREYSAQGLTGVNPNLCISQPARDFTNGIHPGLPMRGAGAHEARFDLLINDLMPEDCTKFKKDAADYDWRKGGVKKTLKEFEK